MPTNEDIIEAAGETGRAAFDAAYMALVADATVDLASIRSAIAGAAAAELLEQLNWPAVVALRERGESAMYWAQVASDPHTLTVEETLRRTTLRRRPGHADAARVALAAAARVLAEG